MKSKRIALVVALFALTAASPSFALDAATPAAASDSAAVAAPPKVAVDNSQPQRLSPYTSFAPIVEKVAPSVVSVYTSKTVRSEGVPREWRRYFRGGDGEGGDEGKERGLGSGVIVSPDGYIVTNNHVTDGADEILVSIGMDKKEYTAKKIGSDPGTDIAVLKIDAKDLPAATFADSDKARVGDIVLAIGNPFALTQTVTMGIISGLGRSGMGITSYENFIQTDASINPGNSGGALVDTEGRVVGINTAIFSRTGGNEGIGFAVPADTVRSVLQDIREKGRVVRGFLGTLLQPMTPELADALKMKTPSGALVKDVVPGSPAEKAGLEDGDVILSVNGAKVDDERALHQMIGGMAPGTAIEVKYLRDGGEGTAHASLGEATAQALKFASNEPASESPAAANTSNILDGITVADVDGAVRRTLRIPAKVNGAVITQIDPSSPGYQAGLREGAVIEELNHQPVKDADTAVALSDKVEKDDKVLLRVWSRDESSYVAVEKK